MIACDFCPFGFPGDIVCMHCPTGYRINFDLGHHPGVGQTFSITMILHMTSQRIDGRIRCYTITDKQETDLTITVVQDKREVNGHVFEAFRYQMNGSTCVRCNQEALRFDLECPATCPNCHKIGLRKHVSFGPILQPPKNGV